MIEKQFLSLDDQIEKLKKLKIKIHNTKKTRERLEENSYYNIMNGYRDPFLFHKQKDKYLKGTAFTEIYALYHFDRQLRQLLLSFLLEVENSFKTRIIYEFLQTKNHQGNYIHTSDSYLKIDNYDVDNNVTSKRYGIVLNMIANMQKLISKNFYKSEAISHYLTKYGYVPLWVIATRMTFGDVCTFYECCKSSNRQAVAKTFHMSDKDLLTNMSLLAFARNHCAHGNRVYCMKKTNDLPMPNSAYYPLQKELIIQNHGKHNLLNVFISLKYFVSEKRFEELIDKTKVLLDTLELRLHSINIKDIYQISGLPYHINSLCGETL